jgi:hypothetical protein
MSDLNSFEEFLDQSERLESATSLYMTWLSIYGASGLIEHYRAMQRAKAVMLDCNLNVAVFIPLQASNE